MVINFKNGKRKEIKKETVLFPLIVARTGFEPVIPALRGRCPKPLDERAYIVAVPSEVELKLF